MIKVYHSFEKISKQLKQSMRKNHAPITMVRKLVVMICNMPARNQAFLE